MSIPRLLLEGVLLSGLCTSPVLAVVYPCPNLSSSDIKYYTKSLETGGLELVINANVGEWQGKQSMVAYGVQSITINLFENMKGSSDSNNSCQYSGIPYTVIFIENNIAPATNTIDLTLKR